MTHPSMAHRFHHFLHNLPEAFTTCNRNCHFQNQTYHATQIKDYTTNNAPFRSTNILQGQQDFYQIGSPRSDSIFPHEYYNNALHDSNISTNHPVTIPNAQARHTVLGQSFIICSDRANNNSSNIIFNRNL